MLLVFGRLLMMLTAKDQKLKAIFSCSGMDPPSHKAAVDEGRVPGLSRRSPKFTWDEGGLIRLRQGYGEIYSCGTAPEFYGIPLPPILLNCLLYFNCKVWQYQRLESQITSLILSLWFRKRASSKRKSDSRLRNIITVKSTLPSVFDKRTTSRSALRQMERARWA